MKTNMFYGAGPMLFELDGSIHDLEDVKRNDAIRQKDLEDLGLKVLRFTTKEITNNLHSVLQRIEKSFTN